MYQLKVRKNFSAAHFLRNYNGKCENIHGHNYTVEIYLQGEKLNETGYVMDFTDIKAHLKQILAQLDHSCLNELEAFYKQNPTAENIARYIYEELKCLLEKDLCISAVEVWETSEQSAKYIP